ncbi:MAG: hypothetical protein PF508_06975, partial [Spirochaeta sp.]|nr:hypothetical protein [Spirochaeta sp.]
LAELVVELTGSRSPIISGPPAPEDPQRRCPDITLARRELQWEPTVSLREGLDETIRWFEHHIAEPGSGV